MLRYILLVILSFLITNHTGPTNVTYHSKPKIGDICVLTSKGPRFMRPHEKESLDSCFADNAIGVVYYVKGRTAKIIGGDFSEPIRWSNATLYSVTSNIIPNHSTECPIYLLKSENPVGIFDYNRSEGSVKEFVDQLNSWFSSKGLIEWSAYMKGKQGFVQYTGIVNDTKGYDFRIAEQSLDRITVTCSGVNIQESFCRNQVKQKKWVCGMNRKRMDDYCRNHNGNDANPSNLKLIDGKKKLYDIIPVSEYFYKENIQLRKRFNSYSDYLDACMVRCKENRYGIMKYKTGKEITKKLANIRIPSRDKMLQLFPAAYYSYNYKANSNDRTEWWLPSMYELALIMKEPDKINEGLSLIPQWNTVRTDVYYWSCCPCNTYYVWFYHCDGMSDANNMCGSDKNGNHFIRAIPVSEIRF